MDRQNDDSHGAWLVGAGLSVLTLSSAAAVCRAAAGGDAGAAAFVVATYVTPLLLLACLRAYERAPPPGDDDDEAGGGGGRRGRLRRAVWSLSTLLTMLFALRVAGVMVPYCLPVALLVWALAAATTVGGYVALLHRPRP